MRSIVTLSAFAVLALALPATVAHGGAVDSRSYATARTALQIDNETRDVRSVEGGVMRGEVVVEPDGNKHIGKTVVEPVRARIGIDDFRQFIATSLADPARNQGVNGAIYLLDLKGQVLSSRDFTDAVLTEVAFPEFSGESKSPATLSIALQPAAVRNSGGKGNPQISGGGAGGMKGDKSKAWTGNFRLMIPGMQTNRVRKIDGFTLTRPLAADDAGAAAARETKRMPAGEWQIPNLVFHVAEQDAREFQQWHDDVFGRGNTADAAEKTMTIELLDQTMKGSLLTLNCTGVGIVSARVDQPASTAEAPSPGMRVEVYVERITLSDKGAGPAPAAAEAPAETPPAAAAAPAPAPAPAAEAPAPATADPAAGPVRRTPAAPAEVTPAPAPAPVRRRVPQ